jgi:hypothetical protein
MRNYNYWFCLAILESNCISAKRVLAKHSIPKELVQLLTIDSLV